MLKRLLIASATLFVVTSFAHAKPVSSGAEAPDFSLPVLQNSSSGTEMTLSSMKGKVVYVDLWASWCGPCRVSLPILNGIREKYSADGFEVLAVNIDEDSMDAVDFLTKHPVSYPVLLDPESSVPSVYEPKGMPTAYLIDKNGVVRYVHASFNKGDEVEIEEKILKLLAE